MKNKLELIVDHHIDKIYDELYRTDESFDAVSIVTGLIILRAIEDGHNTLSREEFGRIINFSNYRYQSNTIH